MYLIEVLVAGAFVAKCAHAVASDPFEVIDPQSWVNPDDMTWDDYIKPPGTNWKDPSVKGSVRNFKLGLITVDYPNQPFVITQKAESTIFGNPQPIVAEIPEADVPKFYQDLLNTPNELNGGHTLHEYWMEDSEGRFGVDLDVYGTYRMPRKSWQYGVEETYFNAGACPKTDACDKDLREDALGMWRADVGDEIADTYEFVFILSAGQDETGSWQEFGEMKFASKEKVTDSFGPPENDLNVTDYGNTRYVEWTSWAAASTIWPNALGGVASLQAESSGMAVFAHELSHLLVQIGDNYNNPWADPPRRAYTGPWSMMSRGTLNGPGGTHTRWQIPALRGGSMGSLHTVRDKLRLNLIDEDKSLLHLSRSALAESGLVIASLTARAVQSDGLMGIRVNLESGDLSAACDTEKEVLCDGGGYNHYFVEVVDRMGSDSFQPDSGVLISKSKESDEAGPFQWAIDANPEDINIVDFEKPSGGSQMVTMGDYRQLADALFHAGTRSGSQYEYIDEANSLHFYILNKTRDGSGALSYEIGVRSLNVTKSDDFGIDLETGTAGGSVLADRGVFCSFKLNNNGTSVAGGGHPQDVSAYLGSDIYRLKTEVKGKGWKVEVPNAFASVKFGDSAVVNVAVGLNGDGNQEGLVTLTARSESDETVESTAQCHVSRL